MAPSASITHTDVKRTAIRLAGIAEEGEIYGRLRIFVGLRNRIEFHFMAPELLQSLTL